jgi:hypothetical protein
MVMNVQMKGECRIDPDDDRWSPEGELDSEMPYLSDGLNYLSDNAPQTGEKNSFGFYLKKHEDADVIVGVLLRPDINSIKDDGNDIDIDLFREDIRGDGGVLVGYNARLMCNGSPLSKTYTVSQGGYYVLGEEIVNSMNEIGAPSGGGVYGDLFIKKGFSCESNVVVTSMYEWSDPQSYTYDSFLGHIRFDWTIGYVRVVIFINGEENTVVERYRFRKTAEEYRATFSPYGSTIYLGNEIPEWSFSVDLKQSELDDFWVAAVLGVRDPPVIDKYNYGEVKKNYVWFIYNGEVGQKWDLDDLLDLDSAEPKITDPHPIPEDWNPEVDNLPWNERLYYYQINENKDEITIKRLGEPVD